MLVKSNGPFRGGWREVDTTLALSIVKVEMMLNVMCVVKLVPLSFSNAPGNCGPIELNQTSEWSCGGNC